MRIPGLSACLLTLAAAGAGEADSTAVADYTGDVVNPSADYVKARSELEAMLATSARTAKARDFDQFEIQFEPISFERVVMRSTPTGTGAYAFHALVFRIENRTVDTADRLAVKYKGYSQVLKAMADQYASAKVVTEGGSVQLRIDGVQSKDGLIVERQENRARKRRANLIARISTENLSRLVIQAGLTDQAARLGWERAAKDLRAAKREGEIPPAPGVREWPKYPDPGQDDTALPVEDVRRFLEEKHGRRLLTPSELMTFDLDPFDGVKRIEVTDINDPMYAMRGWYAGEAYGVFVFPAVNEQARSITIRVDGLTNKIRRDYRQADPPAGQEDDFYARRNFRRSYVIQYSRPGDEFYRDSDPITLVDHGWRWLPAFIRIDTRREISHATYILDNIRQQADPDKPDTRIETERYARLTEFRAGGELEKWKQPILESDSDAVKAEKQAWNARIDAHVAERAKLPDFEKESKPRTPAP